jgi:hypothetical protein
VALLDVLHVFDSRLPMTYRGLRNSSLTATTLRIGGGQSDLQARPRAIGRDKDESPKGTDNDQSHQTECSKQIDRDRPSTHDPPDTCCAAVGPSLRMRHMWRYT